MKQVPEVWLGYLERQTEAAIPFRRVDYQQVPPWSAFCFNH